MVDRPPRILLVDDEQSIQTLLSYPAAQGRLRGRAGRRRPRGARALRRDDLRPRRARRDDARARRPRGLPAACARAQHGADHHAHRQGRGDRQGPRPRARRRRLHHQAVLAARVPQPREGRAAPRGHGRAASRAAERGAARGRASCGSTRPSAPVEVRGDDGAADVRRVRDPRRARRATPAACSRATCCSTRIWGDSAYRDPRTIDVHIRHLREKLERDPRSPSTSSPCAASATASATRTS